MVEAQRKSGQGNRRHKGGLGDGPGKKGLSKAYILRAVDDSLQRLQTDYIDLYQSHTDDAETPIEETLGAYAELIAQGKVRAIGASNFTADRLAAALEISKKTGLPGTRAFNPTITSMTERISKPNSSLCAKRKESASSITFPWLADFFPANIDRKAMWRKDLAPEC